MTDTFSPPRAPSIGGGVETTARVNEAAFGDGYVQAQPDGLNPIEQTVQLAWKDTLTKAEAQEIVAFFAEKAGSTPFLFTLPDEDSPRKWRCKKWGRQYDQAPLYYGVTAEFIEDFSP